MKTETTNKWKKSVYCFFLYRKQSRNQISFATLCYQIFRSHCWFSVSASWFILLAILHNGNLPFLNFLIVSCQSCHQNSMIGLICNVWMLAKFVADLTYIHTFLVTFLLGFLKIDKLKFCFFTSGWNDGLWLLTNIFPIKIIVVSVICEWAENE